MPAVVNFAFRDSTTSNAWTTLSGSLRFRNADTNDATATTSPLIRPPSGTTYSFWKNLRCRVTTNPAVALLNLRVRASTNTVNLGGVDSGTDLMYAFRTPDGVSAVPTNTATVLSGVVGPLTTTDVQWVSGRAIGESSGGTDVANHVADLHANGSFWNGASGSDQLLLCLYLTSSNPAGGSLDAFNLTLVFNEI